ncbi:MAG: DUF1566 domain-containing protein [Treponema sp.]|jgi:hypothetical protein|nr:DUF1566 domain-containing protein [Treponema sp.]
MKSKNLFGIAVLAAMGILFAACPTGGGGGGGEAPTPVTTTTVFENADSELTITQTSSRSARALVNGSGTYVLKQGNPLAEISKGAVTISGGGVTVRFTPSASGQQPFQVTITGGAMTAITIQVSGGPTITISGLTEDVGGGEYSIGETGPGGGLVFYDKGSYSDGWRYLEAAPASTEWVSKDRGAMGETLGTNTSIGSGKTNTAKFVAKETELGESDTAALLCDGLNFGGKDDWFLPSKDELNEIYTNLKASGKGDFTGEGYKSSSESDLTHLWQQNFNNGTQSGGGEKWNVRAVRAF